MEEHCAIIPTCIEDLMLKAFFIPLNKLNIYCSAFVYFCLAVIIVELHLYYNIVVRSLAMSSELLNFTRL